MHMIKGKEKNRIVFFIFRGVLIFLCVLVAMYITAIFLVGRVYLQDVIILFFFAMGILVCAVPVMNLDKTKGVKGPAQKVQAIFIKTGYRSNHMKNGEGAYFVEINTGFPPSRLKVTHTVTFKFADGTKHDLDSFSSKAERKLMSACRNMAGDLYYKEQDGRYQFIGFAPRK